MLDLSWLATPVELPLWAVLVLAGFQKVTRSVRRAARRRRPRPGNRQ